MALLCAWTSAPVDASQDSTRPAQGGKAAGTRAAGLSDAAKARLRAIAAKRKHAGAPKKPEASPGFEKPGAAAPAKAPVPAAPSMRKDALLRTLRELRGECFVRYPERGLELDERGDFVPRLGTFGRASEERWKRALLAAEDNLDHFGPIQGTWVMRAQLRAFTDWIRAEHLRLDALPLANRDPALYVEHVGSLLRALAGAAWMEPARRRAALKSLLGELPEFLHDARLNLTVPVAPWIDQALQELDDLEEHVRALGSSTTSPKPETAARRSPARDPDPIAAIDGFRRFLQDVRGGAVEPMPRLGASDWSRLMGLASGARVEPGPLKAQCLRALADIRTGIPPPGSALSSARLSAAAGSAATKALQLGKDARLIKSPVDPSLLSFAAHDGSPLALDLITLQRGPEESLRALLELPGSSWSVDRTRSRRALLDAGGRVALGVRHGLAGDAGFARALARTRGPMADLIDNRMMREAFGLYTLDWIPRVDWVANPWSERDEAQQAFRDQQLLEAARLIATIELHVEGLTLDEAARAFRRRTNLDAETARLEALASARDPLRGIGYLGLLEMLALEERQSASTNPRAGLARTLKLVTAHPELRPADLAQHARRKR